MDIHFIRPPRDYNRFSPDKIESFLHWVEENGGDWRGCQLKLSKGGPPEGLGIYAPKAGFPPVVGIGLTVPLKLAIIRQNILADPRLGDQYEKLLQFIDERHLVVLFIVIEQARGAHSFWAPYLGLLPATAHSPAYFSLDEIDELKGTPLHTARRARRQKLRDFYEGIFEQIAGKLLKILGLDVRVTFDDLLWGDMVFWSRALSLKLHEARLSGPGLEGRSLPGKEEASTSETPSKGAGSVSHLADEAVEGKQEETHPVIIEGLVPGIDFCNHSNESRLGWGIGNDKDDFYGVRDAVFIFTEPGADIQPESELFLNYGGKGNEELLFLYGFVIEDNRKDTFMLHIPPQLLVQNDPDGIRSKLLGIQALSHLQWLLQAASLDREMGTSRLSSSAALGSFGSVQPSDPDLGSKSDPSSNLAEEDVQHALELVAALAASVESQCGIIEGSIEAHATTSQEPEPPDVTDLPAKPDHEKSLPPHSIFHQDLMAAFQIVSMDQEQLDGVFEAVKKVRRRARQRSVEQIIMEKCGFERAYSLLIQLLQERKAKLEEGTGTEDSDKEKLLQDDLARFSFRPEERGLESVTSMGPEPMSRTMRNILIYRLNEKRYARRFLEQAELELTRYRQWLAERPSV